MDLSCSRVCRSRVTVSRTRVARLSKNSLILVSGLGTKLNLLGSDAKEIALVDQWIHFAEQEIGAPSYNVMGLIFGFAGPFSREVGIVP
jgi:hypothetical protein